MRQDQRADFAPVVAGEHDILHVGRAVRDQLAAQRSDADPGAGVELEILGDASVEHQAALRIGRIDEADRIAAAVKAVLRRTSSA